MRYDRIIIGGGIVGLASALALQRAEPRAKLLLLEKEDALARHQTGRNSGVIHAGVYYAPGSLKARYCRAGMAATYAFCESHRIPVQRCGKLLVATDEQELEPMHQLAARCAQNGIEVEAMSAAQLHLREPNISGLAALWVPATGIVDYRAVCQAMAQDFCNGGGQIALNQKVQTIDESDQSVRITTQNNLFEADMLVACAGLQSDRIAQLMGLPIEHQIIPFRGEYYRLSNRCNGLINHLIYPIPNPALPFLGVHLTRLLDGGISVGPNAVLGWHREGYGRYNLRLDDMAKMLGFAGFWATLKQQWRPGLGELGNSWSKRLYLERIRRYCPQLTLKDLTPHPVGIRAQAVLKDGTLVHDFLFAESPRSLHVCNAPSPAATSAIPIGQHISDRVQEKLASLT